MRNVTKDLDDAIDTIAALVDQNAGLNSPHYRTLHQIREAVQIARADGSEYLDPMFGVCEDVLSRAIANINARRQQS